MSGSNSSEISKKKISDRDRKEFDRLFTKYFVKLATYAYKYVKNVAVAQDLAQSVFLKVWELNGNWNPKGTIRAYLYVAVKNKCLNHIKHNKVVDKRQEEKKSEEPKYQSGIELEDEKRVKVLEDHIQRAIKKMPDKRREIFELSRDEGLTYKEIAQIKGITKKTVENHIGRALKLLKDELKEWL